MDFLNLDIKRSYISCGTDSIASAFLVPALKCTKKYKRSVGFFSSGVFEPIMDGIVNLSRNGGTIQLIASPKLSEDDIGVDTISSETAINSGGFAIEYLGDSMIKRMKNPALLEAIQNGQLLLLSFVNPDAGFFTGNLMARNKFIYAQSVGTVIVRSEKKGGTWTGANENLRNGWCASFCWNKPEYDGNQELIRLGCIPIDDVWDGNPEQSEGDGIKKAETVSRPADGGEQLLIPGFE